MQNIDETSNEKTKGNMLQNENREDEAAAENSTLGNVEDVKKVSDSNKENELHEKATEESDRKDNK